MSNSLEKKLIKSFAEEIDNEDTHNINGETGYRVAEFLQKAFKEIREDERRDAYFSADALPKKAEVELRKLIEHQLQSHINNCVGNIPQSKVKWEIWQDGFQTAYQQALKVIRYGHTNVGDPEVQADIIKRVEKLQETSK